MVVVAKDEVEPSTQGFSIGCCVNKQLMPQSLQVHHVLALVSCTANRLTNIDTGDCELIIIL